MMLPWLAGHSFAQTMMLVGGLVICLGYVVKLITTLLGGQWYLFGATLSGLATMVCLTAAVVLRGSPGGSGLMGELLLAGGFSSLVTIILRMMHRRSKQASAPLKPQAAVHSDEIWPPPPTAPSNDHRK